MHTRSKQVPTALIFRNRNGEANRIFKCEMRIERQVLRVLKKENY
jgi:hypothetical protein